MSAPPAPPRRPKLQVSIRRARLRDLPALVRLYRHRSEESKQTYHPFPFSRGRLTAIYLWMIIVQHWMRYFIVRFPRLAATLLVAERPDRPGPIGYGTIRLMSGKGEEPIARFGYMVSDECQGQGVGSQLTEAMVLTAKGFGIRKGGGTVLQTNVASARLIANWGWRLKEGEADRGAPEQVNLVTVADLDDILRRRRGAG
jgi:RimJ/RimL family protein N-acetyltransferase